MASLKIVLSSAPRKDNTYAVRFRIIINRVTRYVNTGIFIEPEAWNPKPDIGRDNWVLKKVDKMAGVYNIQIANELLWLKTITQTNRNWTADQIKEAYEQRNTPPEELKTKGCFLKFSRDTVKIRVLAPETVMLYHAIIDKLEHYTGKPVLPCKDLNLILVRGFLKNLKVDIGNKDSTIKLTISTLSNFAEEAVKAHLLPRNVFKDLNFKAPRSKKKERPNAQQLDVYKPDFRTPLKGRQIDAWNVFCMQYHLHGARVKDVLQLEWGNFVTERGEYTMSKNNRFKSIKRTPEIDTILEYYKAHKEKQQYYVFPFLKDTYLTSAMTKEERATFIAKKCKGANRIINRALKEIAVKAGITIKLSSHMARHMFADALFEKVNDMRVLKRFLGHGSALTSEQYLQDLDETSLDDIAQQVYKH